MLLAMDIGNTNLKTGLYNAEGKLLHSWRMTTDMHRTSDEYGVQMESFFGHLGLSTRDVSGIIISSVVPSINYTIEHMCQLYFFGQQPMMVNSSLELGLEIWYDYPELLGADRICNAVAAYRNYGGPVIIIDFGTATTFSVVSEEGALLGGAIGPGIIVSTEALVETAAMLHKDEYVKPEHAICRNTKDGIQSGIINGYVGFVENIVRQMEKELSCPPTVVATGGMSSMIAAETDCIDVLNPTLTLVGLNCIYRMNK